MTTAAASPTTLRPGDKLRLPGLLILGAMKASTTSFYELLSRRPGVWFPAEKEPHYFTASDYGEPAALRRYARLFADAPEGALLGEASTGYTKLPRLGPTPQRIRETLGEPRLIYLLRDPVERLISNYRHSQLAGHYREDLTLAEAIECDPILVTASLYARQIRAYHEEFGEDALLLITTDELHANPRPVMQQVDAFLGLPPHEAWPEKMPSSNSQGDLARYRTAQRLGPLADLARKVLPKGLASSAKRLVPASKAKAPCPPTAEEIGLVQSLIADDLADLVTLLGDRIAGWPSVARLHKGRG